MSNYDLSHITEVVKSGWTGDMYITESDAELIGLSSISICDLDPIYPDMETLIADWDCKETEDGGVLVYTKPGSKGVS